jgi:hypothetical protein
VVYLRGLNRNSLKATYNNDLEKKIDLLNKSAFQLSHIDLIISVWAFNETNVSSLNPEREREEARTRANFSS